MKAIFSKIYDTISYVLYEGESVAPRETTW